MTYRNPDLLALARLSPKCMCCDAPNHGQVVAAHANSAVYGKGMGLKAHDWAWAAACDRCHAYIDQGLIGCVFPDELRGWTREAMWALGHRKTLEWLFAEGHLVVRPADYVEPVREPKPKAKVGKGRKLQSRPFPKTRSLREKL